jgi:hypothetical protein
MLQPTFSTDPESNIRPSSAGTSAALYALTKRSTSDTDGAGRRVAAAPSGSRSRSRPRWSAAFTAPTVVARTSAISSRL